MTAFVSEDGSTYLIAINPGETAIVRREKLVVSDQVFGSPSLNSLNDLHSPIRVYTIELMFRVVL